MAEKGPPTHTAYALKRENRTVFRWLEIGMARIESHGIGYHDIYVDRLPVGGWTGHIHLSPIGAKPDDPATQQPARPSDGEEDS